MQVSSSCADVFWGNDDIIVPSATYVPLNSASLAEINCSMVSAADVAAADTEAASQSKILAQFVLTPKNIEVAMKSAQALLVM